jgi:predicted pyridoxine 5'-phosphate oxidase superfamily flavin-nucleotide-binding protein
MNISSGSDKFSNTLFVILSIIIAKEGKMAKLTLDMKDMVATQQCFIGTVNADGTPNVAPKRSTRVLSDESLIFTEGTGGNTYANIKRGSKVSVAVVNRDIVDGYRFIGEASLKDSGELFEAAVEASAKMGRPRPLAVAIISISEIQSLKPGPLAGKKIA